MVLDAALLNIQHYKVRIKSKLEQSRERNSAFPYTSVSQLMKGEPSGRPRLRSPSLYIYMYIYIYISKVPVWKYHIWFDTLALYLYTLPIIKESQPRYPASYHWVECLSNESPRLFINSTKYPVWDRHFEKYKMLYFLKNKCQIRKIGRIDI